MKNDLIKKPNIETEYTNDQVLEMYKCSQDPIYFMKNYMKVVHPTRGAVPFEMYPYQERAVKAFIENKWVSVLAGRQLGKCCHINTAINIGYKPKGIKRVLLRIFFPSQYKLIFKN